MCALHLREVAAEAGRPAAVGAGPGGAKVLPAQDAVAAQGVGAPGEVGATFHVAPQQGILVLRVRVGEGVKENSSG